MEPESSLRRTADYVTSFFRRNKADNTLPPRLNGGERFPYGAFRFLIQASGEVALEIQTSTDLVNWVSLNSVAGSLQEAEYVDNKAAEFQHRFYRALTPENVASNILGYVTQHLPPGHAMIANPFKVSDSRIGVLLANVPDGSKISRFDPLMYKLTDNERRMGKWSDPNEILDPGSGVIFFNPSSEPLILSFVGEVSLVEQMQPLPAGVSIRSSLIPQRGRLDTQLSFPLSEGDSVQLFDRERQTYIDYPYDPAKWENEAPVVGLGEAFWVSKTVPANWHQRLPAI